MSMNSETQPDTEVTPLQPIRVETALSRYPVHRLARKGSIDINIHEGSSRDVVTVWEVDYSKKHGQPGPLAYKIDTLIINRRLEEANRPIPNSLRIGSLKEMCRELGMAETGGNTNQIKKSLFQNALAGITAKTTYKQSDGSERTLEAVFTRYSVVLTGEKLPNGKKADAVYILLNEIFMQVINGAMTRPLDYEYLKSLPPAPQRFYELLSYQMYATLKYDRPRARLVYSDFCAHAPQTRHLEWENVRSQMNKVHRPHKQSGYVAKVESQPTTDSSGNADWIFFYTPGPKARAEFRAFAKRGGPTVLAMEPSTPLLAIEARAVTELETELIRRNVTAATAKELVREHAEEKITGQMERVDWLLEKKPDKIEDPAAYLVEAIKNDYAAPKGFISKAERERRAEAKREKERLAAEERRRKQQQEAGEQAAVQAVNAYWASLTPQQQAELDAAMDAQADAETLAGEQGPHGKTFRVFRRRVYIRQLLDIPEPAEA
jgi:hypothetical protein